MRGIDVNVFEELAKTGLTIEAALEDYFKSKEAAFSLMLYYPLFPDADDLPPDAKSKILDVDSCAAQVDIIVKDLVETQHKFLASKKLCKDLSNENKELHELVMEELPNLILENQRLKDEIAALKKVSTTQVYRYNFLSPAGIHYPCHNLAKFCREFKLYYADMHNLHTGKTSNVEGWTNLTI